MEQKKIKCRAEITSMSKLAPEIYDMRIFVPEIASDFRICPGQFVTLYCADKSRLLPRPISICQVDSKSGILRLVFRLVGAGTREFSQLSKGDQIEMMGPLGNGFLLEEDIPKHPVLIGGGIGIPPLLELAKSLSEHLCAAGDGTRPVAVLGYRNKETFLAEEFTAVADVRIATEDGSLGRKGNVLDVIREDSVQADMFYACGPIPMLLGVKNYAAQKEIPAQISLEERMACGIGACLACVCQSNETDSHTNVKNKRICKDGPVFWAQEVTL